MSQPTRSIAATAATALSLRVFLARPGSRGGAVALLQSRYDGRFIAPPPSGRRDGTRRAEGRMTMRWALRRVRGAPARTCSLVHGRSTRISRLGAGRKSSRREPGLAFERASTRSRRGSPWDGCGVRGPSGRETAGQGSLPAPLTQGSGSRRVVGTRSTSRWTASGDLPWSGKYGFGGDREPAALAESSLVTRPKGWSPKWKAKPMVPGVSSPHRRRSQCALRPAAR